MNQRYIDNLRMFYPVQRWENNEILRKPSQAITKITDEIIEFAEALEILMHEYDWAWLAAPQIWQNIRMIATTFRDEKNWKFKYKKSKVFMNPEIVYKSSSMFDDEEWCISLPWLKGIVNRHYELKLKYLDFDWNYKVLTAKWLNARIIQHEVDHLEGILFTDKARDIKTKEKKRYL